MSLEQNYYASHSPAWGMEVRRLNHARCGVCKTLQRWPSGARSIRVRDAYCGACGRKLYRTAAALLKLETVRGGIVDAWPISAFKAAEVRVHFDAKRAARLTKEDEHPECDECATRLVCSVHGKKRSA